MADQQELRGFPILNIWRLFRSQISVLNDLTWIMPKHEQCLLWPIDEQRLILKSRSKMADQQELGWFPILNIWRLFRGQISGVSGLSWTCLSMNTVSYGLLMHITSFWNFGQLRWYPILNIWRPFNTKILAPELDVLMHEQCLLWPLGVHSLILKSWSKMADQREITGSPYLTYGDLSAARSQYRMTWPR